jgi:hypothetical protein
VVSSSVVLATDVKPEEVPEEATEEVAEEASDDVPDEVADNAFVVVSDSEVVVAIPAEVVSASFESLALLALIALKTEESIQSTDDTATLGKAPLKKAEIS